MNKKKNNWLIISLVFFAFFIFSYITEASSDAEVSGWMDLSKEVISIGEIQYFYQDKNKNLWFCTSKGLFVYDGIYHKNRYIRNISNPLFKGFQLKRIFEDSKNNLWLLTDKGIFFIEVESKINGLTVLSKKFILGTKTLNLNSIFEDSRNNIWLWKAVRPGFQEFQTTNKTLNIIKLKVNFLSIYKLNTNKKIEKVELNIFDINKKENIEKKTVRLIGIFENKKADLIFKTSLGYCLFDNSDSCDVSELKGKFVDKNGKDISDLLYWDEHNHHISSYSYYKDGKNNLWFLAYKKESREISSGLSSFSHYSTPLDLYSLIKYDGENFVHYSTHDDGTQILLTSSASQRPFKDIWQHTEEDGKLIFPAIGGLLSITNKGISNKVPWEEGLSSPFINSIYSIGSGKFLIHTQNGITLYNSNSDNEENMFKTITLKKMVEEKIISDPRNKWKAFIDPLGKLLIINWYNNNDKSGNRRGLIIKSALKFESSFINLFGHIENGLLTLSTKNIEGPIILDNLYLGHGPSITTKMPSGKYNVLIKDKIHGNQLECNIRIKEGRREKLQACIDYNFMYKSFPIYILPNKKTTVNIRYNRMVGNDFNTFLKVGAVDEDNKNNKTKTSKYFFDSHGYLWFNSGTKAIRFLGNEIKQYGNKTILFESRSGDLIIKDTKFNKIQVFHDGIFKESNFKNINNTFFFEDSFSSIWFETEGTLGRVNNGKISIYNFGKSHIKAIINNGNSSVDNKKIRIRSKYTGNSLISSFYENLNTKEIWFGTAGKIMTIKNNKLIEYNFSDLSSLEEKIDLYVNHGSNYSVIKNKPGNLVLNITQDELGKKLWFATYNSLYEIEISTGKINLLLNNDILKDRYITSIFYDKYGKKLWLGFNRGIFFYNTINGYFTIENFIGMNSVIGNDWIDTRKIIKSNIFSYIRKSNEFDFQKKLWVNIKGLSKLKNTHKSPAISNIFQDSKGNLWVIPFDIQMVYKYSIRDQKFESFYRERGDIKYILEDKHNQIWLGSNSNNDIEVFDQKNYLIYPNIQNYNSIHTKSIREDRRGNLWIETEKGISLFIQPQFDEFWIPAIFKKADYRFFTPFAKNNYLKENRIIGFKSLPKTSLTSNQSIWTPIGQYKVHIEHNKKFTSISKFLNPSLQGGKKSQKTVSTFIYRLKSEGYISFTTDSYGIEKILYYKSFNKQNNPTILNSPFRSINNISEKDNTICFASSDGAYTYTIGDNKIQNVFTTPYYKKIKNVTFIFIDKDENIWVGTKNDGLLVLKNGVVLNKFSQVYGIPIGKILSIYQDTKGSIWVGTDNGLVTISSNANVINLKSIKPQIENELIGKRVNTIYEDKDSFMWIGLEDGVIKYNKNFKMYSRFISIKTEEEITAISQDNSGDMWFGFSSGRIIRYKSRKPILNYDVISINGKKLKFPFILKRPLNKITVNSIAPNYSIKSIHVLEKDKYSQTKIYSPKLTYSLNLIKKGSKESQNIVEKKGVYAIGEDVYFDNFSQNGNYSIKINFNNEVIFNGQIEFSIPFYIQHYNIIIYLTFFIMLILATYLIVISNQAKIEKLTSFAFAHTVNSSINRTSLFISDLLNIKKGHSPEEIKDFLNIRLNNAYFFANEGKNLVSFILNMPLASRKYLFFSSQRNYNCWTVEKYFEKINLNDLILTYITHFLDISSIEEKLKTVNKNKLFYIDKKIKNKKILCNGNALRATTFELLKNAWRYNNFKKGFPVISMKKNIDLSIKITITNFLSENSNILPLKKTLKKITNIKGGKNSFGRYLVSKFLKQSGSWDEKIENKKYTVWFDFTIKNFS